MPGGFCLKTPKEELTAGVRKHHTHDKWFRDNTSHQAFSALALSTFWNGELVMGDGPVWCGMFSSISSLCPVDASGTSIPTPPVMKTKNVSRPFQIVARGQNCPQLRPAVCHMFSGLSSFALPQMICGAGKSEPLTCCRSSNSRISVCKKVK